MNVLIMGVPGWLGSRFVEVLMQGYAGEGAPVGGLRIRCLADPAATYPR